MAVTVNTAGLQRLMRRLADLGRFVLTIGFQGESAAWTYPSGVNVASVALFQEFGTIKTGKAGPPIPARSFLRRTLFEQRFAIEALYADHIASVVEGSSALMALQSIGAAIVEMVKTTIRRAGAWAKPNEESTLVGKTKLSPLRDTERMLDSVSWAVRTGSAQGPIVSAGTT